MNSFDNVLDLVLEVPKEKGPVTAGPLPDTTSIQQIDPTAASEEHVYGAGTSMWDHLAQIAGPDLVPVVSNPNAVLSSRTSVTEGTRGKVPSLYNHARQVIGLPDWGKKKTVSAEIAQWQQNDDYGICIVTRNVRALDVDVNTKAEADRIEALVREYLPGAAIRRRPNSTKFLAAFILPGEFTKVKFWLDAGCKERGADAVELLAGGQQFVAAGQHPSGVHYKWDTTLPVFEQVDEAEVAALLDAIVEMYPNGDGRLSLAPKASVQRERTSDDDLWIESYNEQREADLRECLFSGMFNPDSREDWVMVGHHLYPLGDKGNALWMEWSKQSTKFDDGFEDPNVVWDSFANTHSHPKALFAEARGRGWINPASREALNEFTRFDRTDAGNMNLLHKLTGGNLRWVADQGFWIFWNGERWERDEHGVVAQGCAFRVSEFYRREANSKRDQIKAGGYSESEIKNLEKVIASIIRWADTTRSRSSVNNMLEFAKHDARFSLMSEMLDQRPDLLGVANGVVNLATGELVAEAREDYVTMRTDVAFVPGAKAPRWERFISEITSSPGGPGGFIPRPELADYLHKALGYSMTGYTREHKMFFAVGDGSNGKSVMFDTLIGIAGPYAAQIVAEALMSSKIAVDSERANPTMRKLQGKRLVLASESKDGHKLNTPLVKHLTGDTRMTARSLNQNPVTFDITHKLWLSTNHRPACDNLDEAIKGRLHFVPFSMRWNRPGVGNPNPKLPDGDKTLPDKLMEEREGILAWLVSGAVRYIKEDLNPPGVVVEQVQSYFESQDPLAQWLALCERCDVADGLQASEAYEAFRDWAVSEGFEYSQVLTQTGFGRRLGEHGFDSLRNKTGRRWGIRTPLDDDIASLL